MVRNKTLQILAGFLLLAFLSNCQSSKQIKELQHRADSLETLLGTYQKTGYLTQAILWYQHAPEVQALYYQGFNTAKQSLNNSINSQISNGKKNAVVVDIDETILNNSLYQGWLLATNNSFSADSWTKWVLDTLAKPLPGAVDFLNYVKLRDCEVFYISNRNHEKHFEATLQNLNKYHLPFSDAQHLLLKTRSDTSAEGRTSKEVRRAKLETDYNILVFIGDQLADFTIVFEVNSDSGEYEIRNSVERYKDKFGGQFILMPNPIYCEWLDHIVYRKKTWEIPIIELDSLRAASVLLWSE